MHVHFYNIIYSGSQKNVTIAKIELNRIILHKYFVMWYFVMFTSIAVNLENIDQRVTETLPFDLNYVFIKSKLIKTFFSLSLL